MIQRWVAAVMLVGCTNTVTLGEKVTFENRTSGEILVRCISGGNQVSAVNEYRQTIKAGSSHSRSDFVAGKRAAVAWNANRSQCTAIAFEVDDGMTLIVAEYPDGGIRFEAPCGECAGSSTVMSDSSRPHGAKFRQLKAIQQEFLVTSFFSP